MKLGSLARLFSRWRGHGDPDGNAPPTVLPPGAATGAGRPPDRRLDELATTLLLQRKWSYLRYLHLREGLLAAGPVESVLAVGAGRGLAELALALEFPDTRFAITDVASERTPNYQHARDRASTWRLPNVEFGILDVTRPIEARYDLVTSVEVVEHIEDDEAAIENMRAAAKRFVFCLVPYADDATLADPRQQHRAWERHQHYRFGYSPERLRALFRDVVTMRGCYFREAGHALRIAVDALDDRAIRARAAEFELAARADISDMLPTPPRTPGEAAPAQGIWVLARASSMPQSASPKPPAAHALDESGLGDREKHLREVRRRLVFYRSWSYLRYLHLRQGFLATQGVSSMISIGSGRGLAELALSIEFPHVDFRLSDIQSPHTSSSDSVMELARTWGVKNLSRTTHDILEPLADRYDLVASVEVLEHIENDALAASNMMAAANGYVFCLVPFADAKTASNPARRARARTKDGHFRFGYAAEDLRRLFPGEPAIVRGCYWQEAGTRILQTTKDLAVDPLLARAEAIWTESEEDLIDRIPERYPESLGIWILAPVRSRSGE